jgi:hypothetical protein
MLRCVNLVELWRRGQAGWPRSYPVAQLPNAPLLAAFAGSGLAAATDGSAHDVGRAVFFLGLGVWAWEEASGGVNGFRRVLGAGFLAWIAVTLGVSLLDR